MSTIHPLSISAASRKQYSPEFKDRVLECAEKEGVPKIAKEFELPPALVYSWRSQRKRGGSSLEYQKSQTAELSKLKRENQRLTQELDFLKKAAAYFAKESK